MQNLQSRLSFSSAPLLFADSCEVFTSVTVFFLVTRVKILW